MHTFVSAAKNELIFLNSFKMKLSVYLGVTHMLFGIVLGGWNQYSHRDWIGVLGESIPHFLFLFCTFG
jgi:V-type H+-transporting ATPase subunit a